MKRKSVSGETTRRQILASGSKVLPALAIIGFTMAASLPAQAEDKDCGACSSSCSGSCYQGCEGSCDKGCTGSCMTGCTGGSK
jgi:CXXX repeat radical SAM target protein